MIITKAISYAITHTFDFSGYAKRRLYWTWAACYFVVAVVIGLLESLVTHPLYTNPNDIAMAQAMGEPTVGSVSWPGNVFALLFLITNLSFIIRRLRDAGYNGGDTYTIGLLWFFIPIIGQLLLLKWLVSPSVTPSSWTLSTAEFQLLATEGHT